MSNASALPRHLVIIGNGIHKDGWGGVCESFTDSNPFYNSDDNIVSSLFLKDHPETALSLVAMRRKFIFHNLSDVMFPTDGKIKKLNLPEALRNGVIERFNRWEDALRKAHSNKLEIHENVRKILPIFNGESIGVITTNWNDSIKPYCDRGGLIFLHGCANDDQTFILPTEFAIDGMNLDKVIRLYGKSDFKSSDILNFLRGSFSRVQNEVDENPLNHVFEFATRYLKEGFRERHKQAIEWLESCKTITFVGIELHTYDAELCSLLMFRGHNKQVFLVNEKSTNESKASYVRRIKSLLNPIEIKYFNGSDLQCEFKRKEFSCLFNAK